MKTKLVWMLFFFFKEILLQDSELLNESFLPLLTFIPTAKPHLIPPNPHSCCCSWTRFCQIIVSHNLIKNVVIGQVCTALLFILYKQAWNIWLFLIFLKAVVLCVCVCVCVCVWETTCLWSSESNHIYYSTRHAFPFPSFVHQIWGSAACPGPRLKFVA